MAKTILIIDHKPGPVRRARGVLERAGFRVEVARDGAAGLSAYERLAPELTLVGEALPDRKGPAICRELRGLPREGPSPILMIGTHRDHDRDRLSCDEYLIHPVDDEALLAAVHRHVRSRDPDRPAKTVSGDLEHLNIAEIVQTLSLGMKTACISLRSDTLRGCIWFHEGKVRHAETGELEGESAFFEMMTWAAGEFSIENGAIRPETTIERDTMFLVMEGLRRIDEAAEAAATAVKEELDLDTLVEEAAPQSPSVADGSRVAADEPHPEPAARNDEPSLAAREPAAPAAAAPPPALPQVESVRPSPGRYWAWTAAALGLLLFSVGALATLHALRPTERSTVAVPIRIGPVADARVDEASATSVARPGEAREGDAPIEYPESPLDVPSVAEMHTRWELLEEDTRDPLDLPPPVAGTEAAAEVDPPAENAATPVAPAVPSEPATPVDDDPPAATATSAPAEPRPQEAVEQPGKIDYSQSLEAANEILARMAPRQPKPLTAPEPSQVDLSVMSSVREGRLTLFVDDEEVLSRELATSRHTRETFDTSFAVDAGEHRVVARLDLEGEGYSYENSVDVTLDEGQTIELELVAARSGRRPITLTVR